MFDNPPVELFILGVCPIIRGTYWEQHDIASSGFLECQGDRDASTLSSQVGLNTKNCSTVEKIYKSQKCSIFFCLFSFYFIHFIEK